MQIELIITRMQYLKEYITRAGQTLKDKSLDELDRVELRTENSMMNSELQFLERLANVTNQNP
jgi:hypothetical protein